MNYYVNYPFGITQILQNKLNNLSNNQSNINNADFIYTRLQNNTYKNKLPSSKISYYKNANYVNNFLDSKGKLCITADNCLANKYNFVDLVNKNLGNKKYIPKSYPFERNSNHSLNQFKQFNYSKQKYILKPENDFSRGGITVIHQYIDIINWLNQYKEHQKWVLQEYIINPLLIDNKKFHFRNYILMIKRPHSEDLELYMYNKYFVLCAPITYNLEHKDLKGHLTGAKYCDVRLVTDNLMKKNNIDFSKIKKQMIEITKDLGYLSKKELFHIYINQTNYHLFACDIICDTKYQCHLLEVNNGGIGTEMNNLESKMCPNGGSLHDTHTITKLFEDIIDIVLKKNTNDDFIKLQIGQEIPLENFSNSNSNFNLNHNNVYIYLYIIIILLFCFYYFIKNKRK
jgi:hypothetical protein